MKTYRRSVRIDGVLHASPRFKKKQDADTWYSEMKRRAQFQKDNIPFVTTMDKELTFLDLASEWMLARQKKKSQATWDADERRLRIYLLPVFQHRLIKDVTKDIITDAFDDFKCSITTKQRIKVVMSQILDMAIERHIILTNPAKRLRFGRTAKSGNDKVLASHEFIADRKDIVRFLECARVGGEVSYLYAALGLMAGLRRSEMLAIRWQSVDLEQGVIYISQKLESASGKILNATKKGVGSLEPVPMTKSLVGILKEAKARAESPYVMSLDGVTHVREYQLRSIHRANVERFGRPITIHGLRHTFGTQLVESGVDVFTVQKLMRHESLETTRIYVHTTMKNMKQSVENIDFLTPLRHQRDAHRGDKYAKQKGKTKKRLNT